MFCVGKRGQTTLEVVILIGFVVAALIAMGVYMKRGIQGKLRESTDQVGEQYSAGNTTSEYTTKVKMRQVENMSRGGAVTTQILENEQKKSGSETVTGFSPGY
jgi:Flp pilus assembly pilin Flp